ncbi:hypothetical protein ACYPKM_00415 [Pseudomonas aeruginosa]
MLKFPANEQPIEHTCSNGTTFKADRADLRNGVKVSNFSNLNDLEKVTADFAEFGAWHALTVREHLNGFPGYDAIKYNFVPHDDLEN